MLFYPFLNQNRMIGKEDTIGLEQSIMLIGLQKRRTQYS